MATATWRARNREKLRKWDRTWYLTNRDRIRAKQHGVPYSAVKAAKETQGGRCAICRRTCKKLWIDHDHQAGQFRALLCPSCNTALGMVGDSVELLQCMINYLKSHQMRLFGLVK